MTTILFLISSEYTFAQTQIKIATLAPQNSEWAEKFHKGSIEIQERTENRVKLKFYWGGAQGNAKKIAIESIIFFIYLMIWKQTQF